VELWKYLVPGGIHREIWIPPALDATREPPEKAWTKPRSPFRARVEPLPEDTRSFDWRAQEKYELKKYEQLQRSVDCELWGIERSTDNMAQAAEVMAEPPLGVYPGRICVPFEDDRNDEPREHDPGELDSVRVTFPDGRHGVKTRADLRHEKESAGETIPGEQIGPGRPRRYENDDLGQTQALVVGHASKWLDTYPWVVDLEGAVFWMVADALVNVTLASAYTANPKVLAKWLPMGKSTIYNRRKKGNGESAMFLERLDEIHREQQFRGALEDLRWSTLFEHLGVSDPDEVAENSEKPVE
jgi:hypothetical protein